MKAKKKGLQKLTVSEALINEILERDKITVTDMDRLNSDERERLRVVLNDRFTNLKGISRDRFYKKIESIIPEEGKNNIWESNHIRITAAISNLMQEYGRMPSTSEISENTDLSRQTIHKHLKEYGVHPIFLNEIEKFQFMTSKVLAKVFKFAVNGDMRAAKLYFNVIGNLNQAQSSNNTLIQNQNNYIQINGIVLSQETIKHLKPEQLKSIEMILRTMV
jgi:hypothetical protein